MLSGAIVNVEVTARNRGTVPETFSLALTDDTDSRTIASLDVTLDPGGRRYLWTDLGHFLGQYRRPHVDRYGHPDWRRGYRQ